MKLVSNQKYVCMFSCLYICEEAICESDRGARVADSITDAGNRIYMLCASSRCPFLWSLDSLLIWKGQAGLGVECLPSMREPWVNCLVLQRQQTPVWKEGNSMSLRHLFSWPSYLGHGPLDNMRGGLRILAWISDWNSHWLITLSPAHPTERTDCFL